MTTLIEKIRERVAATSIRTFSAPYLPDGLIWAVLCLAYTDLILVLIGQPAAYWTDHSRAISSLTYLQELLATGLLSYIVTGLLYLALAWVILTVLTRSVALPLWAALGMAHLARILSWILWKVQDTHFATWDAANPSSTVFLAGLVLGIMLVVGLLRRKAAPGRWKAWFKRGAPIAWLAAMTALAAWAAFWPRSGWVRLYPEHSPGKRGISAVAYDTARERLVLFGGVSEWLGHSYHYMNDTWEWDGTDWTEIKTEHAPAPRASHMMAYDEKRGVTVLFGGEDKSNSYYYSDTWIWDGKDWQEIRSESYLTGRRGGQMFYDHAREAVILCGGFYFTYDKTFTALRDVWAWDGENWQFVTDLDQNLLITNPNAVYDSARDRTALFNFDHMMAWTGEGWEPFETQDFPPGRFGPWLAADPRNGDMLLFGGIQDELSFNDTWLLQGDTWQELHPDMTPGPRDAYVLFFDPARDSFVLYGGIHEYALEDMWELTLP